MKSDFLKGVRRLILACIRLGHMEEASGLITKYKESNPKEKGFNEDLRLVADVDNINKQIRQAASRNDYKACSVFSRHLLTYCPASEQYSLDRLEYMIKAPLSKDAATLAQELQNDYSSIPRFIFLRGLLFIDEGNLDMALKYFKHALAQDPDYSDAQKQFKIVRKAANAKTEAGDFFKAGKYKEAIEKFTECLAFFPSNKSYNSALFLNRAIAYSKLKQYEDALNDLNGAIDLNANYAKAFVK